MYTKKISRTIFIFILAVLVVGVFCTPVAYASVAPNPDKLPRMVTVTFYGQDGTRMSFNWNTTDFCDSDVWVVEATDTLGFSSPNVIKKQGSFYISKASAADGFIHTCVVDNLKLNTKYLYKVGDAELNVWSETGSFITESGKLDKFSFIHVSDPQSDKQHYYEIYEDVLRAAVTTNSPRFIINTGDMVNNNWRGDNPTLQQWEWAITERFGLMKDYPIVATAGNHEAASYDFSSRFNFDVPEGASVLDGCYYSFNYNTVHFIALNTNDTNTPSEAATATGLSEAQMDWLRADLEANKDAPWIIVAMHKAIYDGSEGGNNTDASNYDVNYIRNQIAPLFTQYGVDLVLQGHDHNYSRTFPIVATMNGGELSSEPATKTPVKREYNGQTYDFYQNTPGTVYINSSSASGWKFSYNVPDYDRNLIDESEDGQLMYSAITVDGDTLLIQWYTFDDYLNDHPYTAIGLYKGIDLVPEPAPSDDGNSGGNSGNKKDKSEGGLPVYAIVLICVGGVLVVAAAVLPAVFIGIKKKAKKAASQEQSNETSDKKADIDEQPAKDAQKDEEKAAKKAKKAKKTAPGAQDDVQND